MGQKFLNTNIVYVIVVALILLYWFSSSKKLQYGGANVEERTFSYKVKDKRETTPVQKGEFTFTPRLIRSTGTSEGDAALVSAINTFTFSSNDANDANMTDFISKLSSGAIKGTILVKCDAPPIALIITNVTGARINTNTQTVNFDVNNTQLLADDCSSDKVSIVLKLSNVPSEVQSTPVSSDVIQPTKNLFGSFGVDQIISGLSALCSCAVSAMVCLACLALIIQLIQPQR